MFLCRRSQQKTPRFSFTETLLCHSKITQDIKSKWGQESLHSISTIHFFSLFTHRVISLRSENSGAWTPRMLPDICGDFSFVRWSCANVNLASQTVPKIRHGCVPPPTDPRLWQEKSHSEWIMTRRTEGRSAPANRLQSKLPEKVPPSAAVWLSSTYFWNAI